jgi:glycosidase
MNSRGDKDENKRLPMYWSGKDYNGMTQKPSNADEVNQEFPPVDEQLENPLSILNYYKRAIRIRNENPEIARGEIGIIEEITDQNVLVVRKNYQDSEILIIYNFSTGEAAVNLADTGRNGWKIRGYLTVDGSEVTLQKDCLTLPGYAIAFLK